jgi:hypothetical protein
VKAFLGGNSSIRPLDKIRSIRSQERSMLVERGVSHWSTDLCSWICYNKSEQKHGGGSMTIGLYISMHIKSGFACYEI